MGVGYGDRVTQSQELTTSYRIRSGVKGLIRSGEAVLLLEESHDDGQRFWTLPGGGVESTEGAQGALRREVREELQCQTVVGRRVGSFPYVHASKPGTVTVYTVFACGVIGHPEPNPTERIHRCRWVRPDSSPARILPQVRTVLRTHWARS